MPRAVKGVLVEWLAAPPTFRHYHQTTYSTEIPLTIPRSDPSIKAIILKIDGDHNDFIIEDLDDNTLLVKETKIPELKRRLERVCYPATLPPHYVRRHTDFSRGRRFRVKHSIKVPPRLAPLPQHTPPLTPPPPHSFPPTSLHSMDLGFLFLTLSPFRGLLLVTIVSMASSPQALSWAVLGFCVFAVRFVGLGI
ncbi:hypothetical protein EV426DRAFT_708468 [Tirmania nivea]|nr:hypothetical protein EV426DRAFT_708468 [Tirmania nivea]